MGAFCTVFLLILEIKRTYKEYKYPFIMIMYLVVYFWKPLSQLQRTIIFDQNFQKKLNFFSRFPDLELSLRLQRLIIRGPTRLSVSAKIHVCLLHI